ncbi:MAG TPA: DUF6164 family protein [Burkholderiales bacterium]|nr:DUF6164 family protein [Burkholderiales bacterium]
MLGGVPDDEAEDIRALLSENEIGYYEVPANFMGISPPSIWLFDSSEYARARKLIGDYQVERAALARSEYQRLKTEGHHKTLLDSLIAHPFRFFIYISLIALVIYLSLSPFLHFGK